MYIQCTDASIGMHIPIQHVQYRYNENNTKSLYHSYIHTHVHKHAHSLTHAYLRGCSCVCRK